jgi:hypothetical protein
MQCCLNAVAHLVDVRDLTSTLSNISIYKNQIFHCFLPFYYINKKLYSLFLMWFVYNLLFEIDVVFLDNNCNMPNVWHMLEVCFFKGDNILLLLLLLLLLLQLGFHPVAVVLH